MRSKMFLRFYTSQALSTQSLVLWMWLWLMNVWCCWRSPVRYAKFELFRYFIDIDIFQNHHIDIDIDIDIFGIALSISISISIFFRIALSISISIWWFWKISISIRQFCKISISIKYRIDSNLAYRTGLSPLERRVDTGQWRDQMIPNEQKTTMYLLNFVIFHFFCSS